MKTLVELTVRFGDFGHESKTVTIPISECLARDLMGGVELSDEPLSLLLASPGLLGDKGNAVEIRRRTFRMRRAVAEEIARAMVPALLDAFGINDRIDGYRTDELREDDPALKRTVRP